MPETETWRYRGQTIGREQIAFLREFIREHPLSSRWKLSRQLCEALGWKQANGALRDVVCRGLMLMLARAGEIELPPVRRRILGQRRTARPRPEAVPIDTTPLKMPLGALGAMEIQLVRRTADEPLFESLMEEFHYLRYEQGRSAPPGVAYPRPHGPADLAGLEAYLRAPDLSAGDLHRSGTIPGDLLAVGELGIAGADHGARQRRSDPSAEPVDQRSVGSPTASPVSRVATEHVSEYEAGATRR